MSREEDTGRFVWDANEDLVIDHRAEGASDEEEFPPSKGADSGDDSERKAAGA